MRKKAFILVLLLAFAAGIPIDARSEAGTEQPSFWLPGELVGTLMTVKGLWVQCKPWGSEDFSPAERHAQLFAGDTVRVGPQSRAAVMFKNGDVLKINANTCVEFTRKKENWLKIIIGMLWISVYPEQRKKDLNTRDVGIYIEGTELFAGTRQKIAYVNGGNLWLMNDDGSDKRLHIAAPPGKRIGRSTFSPDGSKIAYEVWDCGGDRYPETSDLWIADAKGGNAGLLASAGNLADPTGRPNFTFQNRLLFGPCFSPDGNSVSCLRLDVYERPSGNWAYHGWSEFVLEQTVGKVVAGTFLPLWQTIDFLGPSPPVVEPGLEGQFWALYVGLNTVWLPDDTILFRRTGMTSVFLTCGIYAKNQPGLDEWPLEILMGWAHEGGLAPTELRCTLGGERIDFHPWLYGYGMAWPHGQPAWPSGWHPHEAASWQTVKAAAIYGMTSKDVGEGTHRLRYVGSDGDQDISGWLNIDVAKGGTEGWLARGIGMSGSSLTRGVYAIPAAGGKPRRVVNALARSLAATGSGGLLAVDTVTAVPGVRAEVHDLTDGTSVQTLSAGIGDENHLGSWDVIGRRLVACSGSGGANTMWLLDAASGSATDLGPGEFPVFAPLYHTVVSCFEGLVSVTDENGGNKVLCSGGQTMEVDDLENGGVPQAAVPIPGPYATKVAPEWGSAVANNANTTVKFEFNGEINPDTLLDRTLTAVSWPEVEATDDASRLLHWGNYADTLNDGTDPNSLNDTIENLETAGSISTSWNTGHTELTVTDFGAGFSRNAGNWCEVSLDLSGVETAGGMSLPFNEARTRFRFVDPVNIGGGEVRTPHGGQVSVPPGALLGATALEIVYSKHLPEGSGQPGGGGWSHVSGVYTFTPTDQTLQANVTIALPVERGYPGMVIWRWNGANWVPAGGTYDSGAGLISAQAGQLGAYAAFYHVPAGVFLRVTKTADSGSAVAGDEVTYSLLLENLGATDAANVVVSDVLAAGLEYVDGSATAGGSYHAGTRTITWNLSALSGQESVWLWFDAEVAAGATYGAVINNTATADCDETGPVDSNTFALQVGLKASGPPRFGCSSEGSDDWANLTALGAGWRPVVGEIDRDEAENPASIDFGVFDTQVRVNQLAGMRGYGIISARPTAGEWPGAIGFAQAFGLYVERYDGDGIDDMPGLTAPVQHWEIFDAYTRSAPRWSGCTLEMYKDYLVSCHTVGHTRNPQVVILNSAIVLSPPSGGEKYLGQMLTNWPWTVEAIDAVSVHGWWDITPYDDGGGQAVRQCLEALSVTDYLEALALGGREVWHTSVDFRDTYISLRDKQSYTCTQEDNAKFLARSVPFGLAVCYDCMIYTKLDYAPASSEEMRWMAMTDSGGNRRISFYVYQKLIQKLEGFTGAELLDFGNNNVGVKFMVGGQPLWMLWNWLEEAATVNLAVGPVGIVLTTAALPTSFDNTSAAWTRQPTPVTMGVAAISVSGIPIYVEPLGYIDPDIDADGIPNEEDADIDGDGMPNDYEEANGLNPFEDDAQGDLDEDGCPNIAEMNAGTNPRAADSVLLCESPAKTGDTVKVTWQSVAGRTYKVQWTHDITSGWFDARDGLVYATGDSCTWYDTGPPRTGAWDPDSQWRFYRVVAVAGR